MASTPPPTGVGAGGMAEPPPNDPLLSNFINDYVNELMNGKLMVGDATPPKLLKDLKDEDLSPGPKGIIFAKKSLDYMIPLHPLHDDLQSHKFDCAGIGSTFHAGLAKSKTNTYPAESCMSQLEDHVSCSLLFQPTLPAGCVLPPPPPPPLPLPRPPTRLMFHTYAGQRTPTFLLRQKLKQLRLAWPRSDQPCGALAFPLPMARGAVALLDKAAAIRHIPRRARADAPPPPRSYTRESARRLDGGSVPGQISIELWMDTAVGETRHECSKEVMVAALEFLALHVEYCARCTPALGAPGSSSCGADGAVPSVDMELLLCSAVLPALEENLAVGIGDMVGHAPLFAATLDLVHAFTLLPAPEARALLGPAHAELVPAQRRPLRALLAEADALVAQYLASLGARGSGGVAVGGDSESAEEGGEARLFLAVRAVARAVSAHFEEAGAGAGAGASASASASAGCDAGSQTDTRAGSAAGAGTDASAVHAAGPAQAGSVCRAEVWGALPSVVTWAGGREHSPAAVEALLDARYEREMDAHKVAACEELRATHHFAERAGREAPAPTRQARRLMQELTAMRRDLPLGRREGVVLRFDEERADLLKVLIIGTAGTPYAGGCFEFHIACPRDYPEAPPSVWLVTTGRGRVRFNPNLYEDGLVCSSLLNQGSGWGDVTWRPGQSNLLEVCCALLWVHMNAEVYFAEPGEEDLIGTEEGEASNEAYCDIVRYGNVRYAMVEMLRHPPPEFRDAIRTHFRLQRVEILAACDAWLATAVAGLDEDGAERRAARRADLPATVEALESWCAEWQPEVDEMDEDEDEDEEDGMGGVVHPDGGSGHAAVPHAAFVVHDEEIDLLEGEEEEEDDEEEDDSAHEDEENLSPIDPLDSDLDADADDEGGEADSDDDCSAAGAGLLLPPLAQFAGLHSPPREMPLLEPDSESLSDDSNEGSSGSKGGALGASELAESEDRHASDEEGAYHARIYPGDALECALSASALLPAAADAAAHAGDRCPAVGPTSGSVLARSPSPHLAVSAAYGAASCASPRAVAAAHGGAADGPIGVSPGKPAQSGPLGAACGATLGAGCAALDLGADLHSQLAAEIAAEAVERACAASEAFWAHGYGAHRPPGVPALPGAAAAAADSLHWVAYLPGGTHSVSSHSLPGKHFDSGAVDAISPTAAASVAAAASAAAAAAAGAAADAALKAASAAVAAAAAERHAEDTRMLGEPSALCGEEPAAARRGGRHPAPNYRADFVEAHNPSLAQAFDGGMYPGALRAAIADLRIELGKL